MKTKHFPTLAILSVTSERLLTQPKNESEGNGIGQLYELLGWMTDDSPFTHQLPHFSRECKPWLLRMHPQLADFMEHICRMCDDGKVNELQAEMIERLGETLPVAKIPQDDHERKNFYDELVAMRGTDEGIEIITLDLREREHETK